MYGGEAIAQFGSYFTCCLGCDRPVLPAMNPQCASGLDDCPNKASVFDSIRNN
jgi:hypothetical protein